MNRRLLPALLGISLVGPSFTSANLVVNGDFSSNATNYKVFPGYNSASDGTNTNPSAPTGWINSGNQQGVDGADTVTSVFGPTSSAGVRDFLFLQNGYGTSSSAQQLINFAPNTSYSLTFSAATRNINNYVNFGVTVNDGMSNVTSATTYAAVGSKFNGYAVNFRTGASAGAGSLTFANTGVSSADQTVDFSNVVLNASTAPIVKNSGFEAPNLGSGGYREANPADNWTQITGSYGPAAGGGIVGNGSAYTNATSPEGIQAGLIKANGGMSQTVDGFVVGQTYTLGLYAESRANYGVDPLNVTVGGTPLMWGGSSTLSAGFGSYNYYTSDPFTVTSTSNVLSFVGTNPNDSAVFIDNVALPEPGSLSLLALGAVGLLARRRHAASL